MHTRCIRKRVFHKIQYTMFSTIFKVLKLDILRILEAIHFIET